MRKLNLKNKLYRRASGWRILKALCLRNLLSMRGKALYKVSAMNNVTQYYVCICPHVVLVYLHKINKRVDVIEFHPSLFSSAGID